MTEPTRLDTVLVANRGEIARRIIRTLRALGIRSVAVFSDADADAPHVREADDAVRIGAAAAQASYRDVDAVISAARSAGANAIHPGYGFLSESAALASACVEAGIIFIGPSIDALEIMGDKAKAREHVSRSGVPVVPGFDARGLSDSEIAEEAAAVGFPLLLKPSAGGGGKGMEVVERASELPRALASARRIAAAAFGDDAMILERLIRRPRHIEVQVFGDVHGTVTALGERECTLQRRHQKVIEEAPSAGIPDATRDRLLDAAVAAAKSVSYVGAGTVEFLVDADSPDQFFFIEMNTRLQVEHPVTEEVTGLDLVALQISVASGERVAPPPSTRGHAVEARVYAESPERGFLPSTGRVLLFDPPTGVRVDAAVESGSLVTEFYDPMIAKIVAHADDRATALRRLDDALSRTVVLGVETNIGFLRLLCRDERVLSGDLDTGLIETLLPLPSTPPPVAALATARAHMLTSGHEESAPRAIARAGAVWHALSETSATTLAFQADDGEVHEAQEPAVARGRAATDDDGAVWVSLDGRGFRLRPVDRRRRTSMRLAERGGSGGASGAEGLAPMPGSVVAVHVADGAQVAAGAPLVAIEAMKMEHQVLAPRDGRVQVLVSVGDQVRRDQTVVRMVTEEDG